MASASKSILSVIKATQLAQILGWPQTIPISRGMSLLWTPASGEDVITGKIKYGGNTVCAELKMNYAGKKILMLEISYDGKENHVNGVLSNIKIDMNKAVSYFRSHILSLSNGPLIVSSLNLSKLGGL